MIESIIGQAGLSLLATEGAKSIAQIIHGDESGSWFPNIFRDESGLRLKKGELIEFYDREDVIRIRIGNIIRKFPASICVGARGDWSIPQQPIFFHRNNDFFQLTTKIDQETKYLISRFQSNGKHDGKPWSIKNIKYISEYDSVLFNIQKCSYFDALRTNYALDLPVKSTGISLRKHVHGASGRLPDFKESETPNHMGVAILIESSDGYLVVQRRSKKVAIRPNTLSASASGSVDNTHIAHVESPFHLEKIYSSAEKECEDELGIVPKKPVFLGLVREFLRGGHPDFYFFAKSDVSLAGIQKAWKSSNEKWESDEIIGFPLITDAVTGGGARENQYFDERVNHIFDSVEKKANLTLSLGLALAYHYITCRTVSL